MNIRRSVLLIVVIFCLVLVISIPGADLASSANFREISNNPTEVPDAPSVLEKNKAGSIYDYEDWILSHAENKNLFIPFDSDGISIPNHNHRAGVVPDNTLAMPGIVDAPSGSLGIYGHVTLNGSDIGGVTLELRYYNGSTWSTRASTNTASDGIYKFLGVPNLNSGQWYFVRFLNDEWISGRIYYWSTRYINSYNGEDLHIGDFDIADIPQTYPSDGANIRLPYSFQWTVRTATPSDNYELNLFDPADYNTDWFMNVGYVNNHTLDCLPNNFSTGKVYGWEMGVYSPDGGYGHTTYQEVSFKNNPTCNGIRGHVAENGINVDNVELELEFWDGSEWWISSNAQTKADGTFKFVNVPSLNPGQKYAVRFSNYDPVAGRLWRWWTKKIDSYTKNSDNNIGDFDIAEILLVQPTDGASISLPYTFQWTPRPATITDSYVLEFFDPINDYSIWWIDLGYTGSYSLGCFWPDLESGTQYGWRVWAFAPDGGAGVSYDQRLVTLSSGPECNYNYLPLVIR
jgi:hypothetical protein